VKLTKKEREELNRVKAIQEDEHVNDENEDEKNDMVFDDDLKDDVQTRHVVKPKPSYIPPQDDVSSSAIDEAFSGELSNENDIIKELFSVKNIYAKTDLSEEEISIVSRLYYLSDYIKHPQLAMLLDKLLMLRISKNRKSREEFVKAHTGTQTKNQQSFGYMPMGNGGFR